MTEQPCTMGLGGAFQANERGQPMQVYQRAAPFFPLDPRPEDFNLEQIAHALSQQCRYGGHTKRFYSVAQHCVLVSLLCPTYPAEGLMHDASEAYLGDIIKPLKVLFPLYLSAEYRMEEALAKRWNLTHPWPPEVKHADLVMLATEKRDLIEPNDLDWGPLPEPMETLPLAVWTSSKAKYEFMYRAKQLGLN